MKRWLEKVEDKEHVRNHFFKGKEVEIGDDTFGVGWVGIGSETKGCEVTDLSSVSCWMLSSLCKSETVWECESSWATGEGDLCLRVAFLTFFFGVWTGSEGPTFYFHFPPFLGIFPTSSAFRKSSGIRWTPKIGFFQYSCTTTLSAGTFKSMASGIEPTKLNLEGSEAMKFKVCRIAIAASTESPCRWTWTRVIACLTITDQNRAHGISKYLDVESVL